MATEKQAKNVIDKVQSSIENATSPVSRQDKKRQEKDRAKLVKDLKEQGRTDEEIKHFFFVQDNAQKANEVFAQMQIMLQKLGYYLQGKIQHSQNDGSMRGAVDLGIIPLEHYKDLMKKANDKN